jgi:hypothetical protein
MKNAARPWCPTCGRTIALAMRWAWVAEHDAVVGIDLDDAGWVRSMTDDPTVDVQCGCCGVTVRVGRDLPLALA